MKREDTIGFNIRSIDNMLMRKAMAMSDEESEKNGMMPVMQGWIMGYLYDHKEEEIFQRDIEAQFYIARSTVTCLVKQMEQKGYIARVAKGTEKDYEGREVQGKLVLVDINQKRFVRESAKKNYRLF